MLKKLLTGCLTIVAAAALAVPAMAADMSGKVEGRATAEFLSKSYNDGSSSYSYLEMQSHARLGFNMSATEGDWTATGRVESRANFGDEDGYQILQKYVQLENDQFSVSLGKRWWGFCYMTPFLGDSVDRQCYGIGQALGNEVLTPRDNRMMISIKNVGVQLLVQMDNEDSNGDSTGDSYNESLFGLQYDGAFGPLKVTAAYVSASYAAIEEQDATAVDTAYDGASGSSLSLGVQYAVSDVMFVEFDYESEAFTPGISGSDTQTGVQMGLAFSMAISEAQGFVVAYDQQTTNSGASGADDNVTTYITANFEQQIAGQKFWVGYDSSSNKANPDADAVVNTALVLGARVNF
jgi:hypothetical protein